MAAAPRCSVNPNTELPHESLSGALPLLAVFVVQIVSSRIDCTRDGIQAVNHGRLVNRCFPPVTARPSPDLRWMDT